MTSVTVLFSPSLCTTCVSCTRRLADDVTVLSFVCRLQRDFNIRKCVEELYLHFIPASTLWLGAVGISTVCVRGCHLAGTDWLQPLVEKNCGCVLYLTERRKEEEVEVERNKEMESEHMREGENTEVKGNNHSLKERVQLYNPNSTTRHFDKKIINVKINKEVNILQDNAMSLAAPNLKGNSIINEQLLVQKNPGIMSPLLAKDPNQPLFNQSELVPPKTSCESELTSVRSVCSVKETRSTEKVLWVSDTDSESEPKFRSPSEYLPGLKRLLTTHLHKPHSLSRPPSLTNTKQNTPSQGPKNRSPTDVIILSSSEEAEMPLSEQSSAVCGEEKEEEIEMAEEDSAVNSTLDSMALSSSPLHNPLSVSVCEDGSDEGIVMDVGVESDSGDGGSVIVVESGDEGRGWLHHRLRHKKYPQFSDRIHYCGMELGPKDLNTLLPNHCLNDQVINCYMKLLMKDRSSKSVFIANSFFYAKLSRSGCRGVQRWMKDVDFSALDLFVVPVHLPVHWCLVAVHIKKKIIEYYDSQDGRNSSCIKRVLRFVLHRLQKSSKFRAFKKRYRLSSALRPIHWRKCYPKELPRQFGSVDCGVFVCQYARWLCNNPGRPHSSIPFTQSHMHRLRYLMKQELESGNLMHLNL